MPDFTVKSPDGQTFKITAPEGVTEDEVLRRVAATKMQPSDPSFAQNFLAGLTAPVRGAGQLMERVADPLGLTQQARGEGTTTDTKVRQPSADESSAGYTLGSMVAPAGVGGAAMRFAPRIIGPVLGSTIAGGAGGALQPVAPEDQDRFWTKKAEQVGTGMTLGFGFGVAGKAAGAGLRMLGDYLGRKYPENIDTTAVNAVLKRIQQDNKYGAPTAQQMFDLVAAANERGKPMSLVDVGGRNVRGLAGYVTRQPGESRQMAEAFLIPRDKGAYERLSADIDKYVHGGQTMRETAQALLESRSAAAGPLYSEADQLQGIWSPRLQEFIENPDIAKGMARGYHIERLNSLAEGRPFNPTMMGVDLDNEGNIRLLKTPNMRVLDMAKQGLDAMIGDHRNDLTGRLDSMGVALEKVRKSYVAELDKLDKTGAYRKARESWGGYSSSLDALKFGRSTFSSTRTPEENAADFAKLSPGNQEFARVGLADIMRERLAKAGLNSDESRQIINSEWSKKLMRPFFKTDKDFNAFVESVTNENTMAQTKNELVRGSQTAERHAEDQSAENLAMQGGYHVAKALVKAPFSPYHYFQAAVDAYRLWRDLGVKPEPKINEAIAKILFSSDAPESDLAKRLLQPPSPTTNYLAPLAGATEQYATPAAAAAVGQAAP